MIAPEQLQAEFTRLYGQKPKLFRAPARVNLIGEHTDYNDGFVLPVAIDRTVWVAAAARRDRKLVVRSIDLSASQTCDLDHPGPPKRGVWMDYVEGTAQSLLGLGVRLVGADLLIASDVPQGAGLSSSAALEMGVGSALLGVSGAKVDRVQLALAGQKAEHQWVGALCGIMDQYIAAMGKEDHALLIDCRSLEAKLVPIRLPDIALVVFDSGVKHSLASSEYNQRRAECASAVELLKRRLPRIRSLRDVTSEQLSTNLGLLPETIARRARHVVTENERTLSAAEALERGDLPVLGTLMAASHRSLKEDYQVSCAELDYLVESAQATPGFHGSRMTGGGFGGCTVNLVDRRQAERAAAAVSDRFGARFGRPARSFVCRVVDGAEEL